jgi:O-6-methylguanine DNA methyltransferase
MRGFGIMAAIMGRKEILKKIRESSLTKFQKKVLVATLNIPRGKTMTYKEIAKLAGNPRAYRAAGTALGKNPFAPLVPCHRVIRSDGKIGNYSAQGGTKRKIRLLKIERAI